MASRLGMNRSEAVSLEEVLEAEVAVREGVLVDRFLEGVLYPVMEEAVAVLPLDCFRSHLVLVLLSTARDRNESASNEFILDM